MGSLRGGRKPTRQSYNKMKHTIKMQLHKTARQLAVEILNRIDDDAAFAEPLLDAVLSKGILERPEDRHLLSQLVYGTLRTRGSLDWVIHHFRKGGIDTLTPPIPNILRTALYQLLYMERLPDYAVVDEAVRITRNLVPAGSGLVNAILREALRKGVAWPDPSVNPDPPAAVSITL
ncbi:MAG: transcription antitermination factor NusB, partial [Syntrophales bacterium]